MSESTVDAGACLRWLQGADAGSTLSKLTSTNVGNAVVSNAVVSNAVVSNVMTQGANMLLGQQEKFDWKGVAIAGIGAMASSMVQGESGFASGPDPSLPDGVSRIDSRQTLSMKNFSMGKLGQEISRNLISGAITAKVESRLYGTRFSFSSVATNAVGNALASSITATEQTTTLTDGTIKTETIKPTTEGPGNFFAGVVQVFNDLPNGVMETFGSMRDNFMASVNTIDGMFRETESNSEIASVQQSGRSPLLQLTRDGIQEAQPGPSGYYGVDGDYDLEPNLMGQSATKLAPGEVTIVNGRYSWVDESGTRNFSDKFPNGYRLKNSNETQNASLASGADNSAAQSTPKDGTVAAMFSEEYSVSGVDASEIGPFYEDWELSDGALYASEKRKINNTTALGANLLSYSQHIGESDAALYQLYSLAQGTRLDERGYAERASDEDFAIFNYLETTREDIADVRYGSDDYYALQSRVSEQLASRSDAVIDLSERMAGVLNGGSSDHVANFLLYATEEDYANLGTISLSEDAETLAPIYGNAKSLDLAIELDRDVDTIDALGTLGAYAPSEVETLKDAVDLEKYIYGAGIFGGGLGRKAAKGLVDQVASLANKADSIRKKAWGALKAGVEGISAKFDKLMSKLPIGGRIRTSNIDPNSSLLPRNGTGGFIDPNVVDKISDVSRRPAISSDGKVIPYGKTEADAITIRNKKNIDANGYLVKDGQKLKYNKDGFPIYDSKYDTVLDDVHFGTQNEYAHFQAANESLARQLKKNPALANEMGLTQQQVKFFDKIPAEGIAPPGLTWHHHQDLGRMQLVDEVQHKLFKHTGGMSIWGGGYK